MPTTQFVKDLWMLQEFANSNLEVGSDLVRKSDIDLAFQPTDEPDGKVDWEAINSALVLWEADGYIKILADLRECKHKDYCFQTLRPIAAISTPADLLED